ncbi:MAG: divalent-cation tolerance protein CutA, partial [Desulfofustis sp.]|nr:divalent-cation tolerance protein CutA [Desulfofustis sp.]
SMQPILVTTSCATRETAQEIATRLLNQRLVACAQVSGPVISSYWWQEHIASEPEYLVKMKSVRSLFPKISQQLAQIHPYQVPEIIAVDIVHISDAYRDWLISELHRG